MACYVTAGMKITNPQRFGEFVEVTLATVQRYGGKYLVRGGSFAAALGDRTPGRLVVIEFDSMDQARAWYDSPEFESPKQTQARSSNSNYVFVEGVQSTPVHLFLAPDPCLGSGRRRRAV